MDKYIKTRTGRIYELDTDDVNLIIKRLPKYTFDVTITNLGTKEIKETIVVLNEKGILVEKEIITGYKYIKEVTYSYYLPVTYEKIVNELISRRYTIQDELAIQRKYKKGVNSAEFDEYDAYAEECKAKAKAFIAERDKAVKEE